MKQRRQLLQECQDLPSIQLSADDYPAFHADANCAWMSLSSSRG
jgi:hypothetical protein